MACDKCGARRGHLDGCPTQAGASSTRSRRRNKKKNIMRPGHSPTCRTCDGDGSVVEHYQDKKGIWRHKSRTCPDCQASGRIDE